MAPNPANPLISVYRRVLPIEAIQSHSYSEMDFYQRSRLRVRRPTEAQRSRSRGARKLQRLETESNF